MKAILKTAVDSQVKMCNTIVADLVTYSLNADDEINELKLLGIEMEHPKQYKNAIEADKMIEEYQKRQLAKIEETKCDVEVQKDI